MPEDQAHEQNNKIVKIDGGAIGILDNATALIKWMIAGPEIARLLELFENSTDNENNDISHHEDTDAHEKRFRQDVISFKDTFEELGNPFEENDILVNAVSKNIMNEGAAESVRLASVIGQNQYQIPDVNDWGWKRNENEISPRWMLNAEASKACYELVRCSCKRNFSSRCKCKQYRLECTELCKSMVSQFSATL